MAGDAPSTKVYEDDSVICIMDIFPWAKGHCLVVPKDHHPTIFEIPEDTISVVFKTARRIAPAIRDGLHAEGLNLLQSNGEAAWQTVPHFHLHLIPRWANDALQPPGVSAPAETKEIADLASRIKEQLR